MALLHKVIFNKARMDENPLTEFNQILEAIGIKEEQWILISQVSFNFEPSSVEVTTEARRLLKGNK